MSSRNKGEETKFLLKSRVIVTNVKKDTEATQNLIVSTNTSQLLKFLYLGIKRRICLQQNMQTERTAIKIADVRICKGYTIRSLLDIF